MQGLFLQVGCFVQELLHAEDAVCRLWRGACVVVTLTMMLGWWPYTPPFQKKSSLEVRLEQLPSLLTMMLGWWILGPVGVLLRWRLSKPREGRKGAQGVLCAQICVGGSFVIGSILCRDCCPCSP